VEESVEEKGDGKRHDGLGTRRHTACVVDELLKKREVRRVKEIPLKQC
jgi:hypothetical protein